MSASFLDGNKIKDIRKNILKLNIGGSFDASYIGYGTSYLTDRGKQSSINELKPNVKNEARPSDLQEPLSISLLRNNKYGSTVDGYREVTIDSNPKAYLGNPQRLEYDDLVEPFIGIPISTNVPTIVDVKTLILSNNISNYKDTPVGLIGVRILDELLKENISSNIDNASLGRFNTDPVSLLKGQPLITENRSITTVNPTDVTELTDPTLYLKAGTNLVNKYLGLTQPFSLIPEAAIGIYQDLQTFSMNKRKSKGFEDKNKITNFLNNVNDTVADVTTSIQNTLASLGVGNPNDLSTESRMQELLNFTSSGQRGFMVDNLSNNIYQPGYSYSQGLLRVRKLADFQANTIKNNLINRGKKDVFGLLGNQERYKKFNLKGAYNFKDNDDRSVLKSNGKIRVGPEVGSNVRNYMFSIENLAWADVSNAFMSETERGIGDRATGLRGKMMWFPPYDLKVSDDTTANWEEESFLGRPEPVYTYNNSSRSGTLNFKIIVDHPSIINLARGNQSNIIEKYFNGEFQIDEFNNLTSDKNTEDQKRESLKNSIGNKKRKKKNVDSNEPTPDTDVGLKQSEGVQKGLDPTRDKVFKEPDKPSTFWSDVEATWFNEMNLDENISYKYLAEKIQHFHPAFHSTSPEGFNARLTFLHQCMRQGPSITEGAKGVNGNLSFGRPPVCILRVGDFFYTKVVFKSLSISFDESSWDLNPDGIGVQPMIADITLAFDYIGGSSLTGPINRLQNSISFNYYANTEIYEQRSQYWDLDSPQKKGEGKDGYEITTYKLKDGLVSTTISYDQQQNNSLGKDDKIVTSGNQINEQNNNETSNSGGQLA